MSDYMISLHNDIQNYDLSATVSMTLNLVMLCHYAQCCYAECGYAHCCYAECCFTELQDKVTTG